MPSPRPEPTVLKVIKGNPGKGPLPENEPKPEPLRSLRAPAELSDMAAKHWKVVVKQLSKAKILTEMDIPALIVYCESYAQWQHAVQEINKYGPVTWDGDIPKRSPYVTIVDNAFKQCAKMLSEFGMTPSSRTRVRTTDPVKKADPWDTL